ncbi:MAG: sigma-70 family RNA polymerase sigma factor, partial [Pyrinomonadaceae bacterium]
MIEEQRVNARPTPDPGAWVDEHGDSLFRYAMFRLRDAAAAEDAVQETLLAAIQSYHTFAGRGAERTWLVGILKHKITDHFRRLGRETQGGRLEDERFEHPEFFRQSGEWKHHWEPEQAPVEWGADPEGLLEQSEFFEVLNRCLSPLPARVAGAFTLREADGLSSEEICETFGISTNNL